MWVFLIFVSSSTGTGSFLYILQILSTSEICSIALGFHILCSTRTFHFFVASLPAIAMKETIVWLLHERMPYLMLFVSPGKGSVLALISFDRYDFYAVN